MLLSIAQANCTGSDPLRGGSDGRAKGVFLRRKQRPPEDKPTNVDITQRRAAAFPDQGGGCLNQTTWVANPQFFLDLPHKTPVQLTLTQNGTHAIGLCVVRQDRGDDGAAVEKVVNIKQDRVVGLTERFVKGPAVDMYLDDLECCEDTCGDVC